jgi:XisH protein
MNKILNGVSIAECQHILRRLHPYSISMAMLCRNEIKFTMPSVRRSSRKDGKLQMIRMLFPLAASADSLTDGSGRFIGARRDNSKIAVEIKDFRGNSAIADLEQAIGQYVLYRLLLDRVDPQRELYLAVSDRTVDEIFSEPIGELVISKLPLKLLIVDIEMAEVRQWIPPRQIETL